jgi:GT2 family glycosyltransferase
MDRADSCPVVGIVILNWNQPTDTVACLESLQRLEYPSFEIVVVDNGSTDGSPNLVAERFPQHTLIRNPKNFGFAAGNNVGVRHLLRSKVDYVLLLNNDTEVSPDMLRILVEAAESDPHIGVVGPKIYYFDQQKTIWSAGGEVDRLGHSWHRRADELDDGSRETIQDVGYVTGCAILVKASVIESIGVLDERFFIYFEETEWCARARHAGFRVVYEPGARMWHKIEQTARNTSRTYMYLMTRNRLLYLKCSGAGTLTTGRALIDVARTTASWWLRPRHRELRPYCLVLLLGARDFLAGRFGPPPATLLSSPVR